MDFLAQYADRLHAWWFTMSALDRTWLGIGLFGQTMFVARWFVQWIASERERRSIVPELFWYCSLCGGLLVLAYGIYKPEPVLVLGQFGVFIYARNIYLIWRAKAEGRDGANAADPKPPNLPAE
ncbi:MAG: lipid-A-disaccharide synthase N-terminal domain-containing protein [Pseudomonadota bacterium]